MKGYIRTSLVSIIIALSLVSLPSNGIEQATAQDLIPAKWVLKEVQINSAGVLPDYTHEKRRISVDGKAMYGTWYYTTEISAQSMSGTVYIEDPEGNRLWDQSYTFNYTAPPGEFISGEVFVITANGNLASNKYIGENNSIGWVTDGQGVKFQRGLADSAGNWKHRPGDKHLEIGERTSYSNSMTYSIGVPNAREPVPDNYYRIEARSTMTYNTADGDDSGLIVAWIYQATEIEEEPTPESSVVSPTPSPTISPESSPKDDGTSSQQGDFIPSGPLNSDCSINQEEFDRDWLKYSDFDEAIPLDERSWEAKQYHDTLDQAMELMFEAYLLERDMEIARLIRVELKALREALGRNLKQNLMKSFIRLTWLTYDTIKPAIGRGRAFARVLTEAETSGLQQIAAVTNFVRDNIPADSSIALDTKKVKGKVLTVGAKGTLDAMDAFGGGNYSYLGNLESTAKVASGLVGEALKQTGIVPPGPKLTQADFDLLKNQFDRTRMLDTVLAESYRINSEKRARIKQIEVEVAGLRVEADDWESKEKERVQRILEEDCRQQKERFEEEL